MADVLLTHSYFLRFDPKEYRAMMPYPPLATLYVGSYLRERGYDVALHDTMFSASEDEILSSIHLYKPRLVVICDDGFNYLTKMCLTRMREACLKMSRIARDAGCTVVISSSDATDHAEEYLRHGAHFIVSGEAEVTIAELVDFLAGKSPGTSLNQIDGLIYRDDHGIARTHKRRVLEDLDILPFPAWDLVDIDTYRSLWKKHHGYFSVNIVTTRGCPYHCNWCAKPIYGQVYHARSPENVVEEMKFLYSTVRSDHIWFADDIFGLKPGWIARFDELVERKGMRVPFKCLSRVDLLLQENTIRHLRHAGCKTVWVGAESGSQKVLDAMEKGTSVDQIYRTTRALRSAGIRVGFFLQFGYPGETREDIDKTISMVRDCMPDEIGISVSYPLPGTKFYDQVKQQLSSKQNWVVSEDLDLMFQGEFVPDFYRKLHTVVHKQFSIWRGRNRLREMIARPLVVDREAVRHILGMLYHTATLPIERRSLLALEKVRR